MLSAASRSGSGVVGERTWSTSANVQLRSSIPRIPFVVAGAGHCFSMPLMRTLSPMSVDRSRRAKAARKRKRRMDRVEHDLSDNQWAALKVAWGRCAYCGRTGTPLQRDCVLALSRGGRYTLDNIVPACRSCNTSKCNDKVTSWLRRKRLDEPTFLLRRLEIHAVLALRFPAEPKAPGTTAS